MNRQLFSIMGAAVLCALPSLCQDKVPIYRVTIVQRNVDSVNYQYRSGPTKIDFRGTVLLPGAKGDATVDPQKGRTGIDAKFEGLAAPQRYGPEYLSYVLWAITPDGAAHNLGEIVPNSSDKGHLPVTTDLQAFGLIVTAEPYAAVRRPSDVVVLQNQVRPDTIGDIRPIRVRTELMQRGDYTWNVPSSETAGVANAPKVSMGRYNAILQVYEAQNALGVAQAAGAQHYAPEVLAKAQAEYNSALQLENDKGNDDRIVQHARAAIEIAEDARTIAERNQQQDALIAMRKETVDAQQVALQAAANAEMERQRADSAEAQVQAEREARMQAESQAQVSANRERRAESGVVVAQIVPAPQPESPQTAATPNLAARDLRVHVLQRMNMAIVTRDTPRGLDASLSDGDFTGVQLRASANNAVGQLAAAIMLNPGLRVSVEGECDSPAGTQMAAERAGAVAAALQRAGVPASQITSMSAGASHPIVSNATERGRMENRRVEIIVSGDPIGSVPSWDRTYSLEFGKQ